MTPRHTWNGDPSTDEQLVRQLDVEISEDRWQALDETACRYAEHPRRNLSAAFADARNEYVVLVPNIIVDGDVKGVEDLSCWSESETDE